MSRTLSPITQCATNGFSILLSLCVDLLLGYKWSFHWSISETECKSYSTAKTEGCMLLNSSTIAPSILFNLQKKVSHSNRTSPHISSHSSMRHKQFFDIIEHICRFTFELQMKLSLMHFRDWMQKLLSCKCWEVWMSCWIYCRQSRRPPYLIYWTLTYPKIFFWKNILGHPC